MGNCNIKMVYDNYYSSGLYDTRYPKPNISTFNVIRKLFSSSSGHKTEPAPVLDFGAGSGRYCIPLLKEFPKLSIVAVEPSLHAQTIMKERAINEGVQDRLEIHSTIPNSGTQKFSYALLIFGVLAHVTKQKERFQLLDQVSRNLLKNGILICTVPNLYRRFFLKVASNVINNHCFKGASKISYVRSVKGGDVHLDYQLYTPSSLDSELKSNGFQTLKITPESILPESYITRSFVAACLDAIMLRSLPATLGYGIIGIAVRN